MPSRLTPASETALVGVNSIAWRKPSVRSHIGREHLVRRFRRRVPSDEDRCSVRTTRPPFGKRAHVSTSNVTQVIHVSMTGTSCDMRSRSSRPL